GVNLTTHIQDTVSLIEFKNLADVVLNLHSHCCGSLTSDESGFVPKNLGKIQENHNGFNECLLDFMETGTNIPAPQRIYQNWVS
ncbi:MAG TPA: hypothetical protein VGD54_12650, partial [Steroidobacteraceae bacterium]